MSFTSGQILTASQLNVFTPGTKIKNATGSASDPTYTFDGDANTGMFRPSTDALGFSTGGTERLTILQSGNVGIGTSSPANTLHVHGGTANFVARLESTDSEAYLGLQDNASSTAGHVAVGAIGDDLVFRAGNDNRVRVKNDGDTGIGTTSPSARLHVNAGATNNAAIFESTDAGALISLKDNTTSGDSHVGLRADGDILKLRSNNLNQVTISANGNVTFLGKLLTPDGSASTPAFSFSGDPNTGMFSSAADQLGLATGGSERVTIASHGDVGIGTTSPAGDFELTANTSEMIFSSSPNKTNRYRFDANFTDSADFGFSTSYWDGSAYVRAITLLDSGNVGIGDTSPSVRLHVNSGTTNTVAVFESTDAGAIVAVKDNSTSGNAYNGIKGVGNSLVLRANNTDHVTIATDGSIRATDASASAPTYTFASDTNTGFFITGNNGRIHFSGNGTEGGYLLSTGGRFVDGSASAPSYAFKDDTNSGMFSSGADEIAFAAGGVTSFQILTNGVFVPSGDNYFGVPTTGTGNDAEWSSTGLGTFMLKRNSSLTAEKENITADLGAHLTADMIDSVVPKLWNRTNSPGYPEIGPLAEDMDAISPFLAAHGADIRDGTYQEFLTGINKTAYLSLLVLAVKDLRTRVAQLESA